MRTKMFLCSMLALTMLLPTAGWSQERQKQKDHPMREKWAQLGLTEQQETKLKELHKKAAPARRERMKKIGEVREQIKQELLKEKPSKKTLDDYANRMGALHKEMNAASIDHLLKVKAILTPEQFAKFTDKGFMGGPGANRARMHRGEEGSTKGNAHRTRAQKQKGADCDKGKSCCREKGGEAESKAK